MINGQIIKNSFTKSFLWSAYMVDNNLSGNLETEQGDTFVNFPKNGKLILEYKDFGAAGNLCYLIASLPNLEGEGYIESPPIKLEDVDIMKFGNNYLVKNKFGDYQFTIMESPSNDGTYGIMINEPALVRNWIK